MNRRTFLFGSLATPPIVAAQIRSRKPFDQTRPVSKPTYFTCIVGDYERNVNGHTYTPSMWVEMFNCWQPATFCVLDSDLTPMLPIESIAGQVSHFDIGPKCVQVTMKVMNTPKGDVFRELYAKRVPLFLTPFGMGKHDQETGAITEYAFSYFSISNSTAFECATVLEPVAEIYIPSPKQPGARNA